MNILSAMRTDFCCTSFCKQTSKDIDKAHLWLETALKTTFDLRHINGIKRLGPRQAIHEQLYYLQGTMSWKQTDFIQI